MNLRRSKFAFQSFLRNVRKRKYYSMFRFFWDSKYRSQVNHMVSLVTRGDVVIGHGCIPLRFIVQSHDINYPEWVKTLETQIRTRGYKSLEPIKIIWDHSKDKWLIVDGNHRLVAMKKCLSPTMKIPVLILRLQNDGLSQNGQFTVPIALGKVEVRDITRKEASSIVLGVPYKIKGDRK